MEDVSFDEMRKQFAIIKKKLDKEEIVNDRLLRSIMKIKVRAINEYEQKHILIATICLILYPGIYMMDIISLELTIATCLMMVFCWTATMYIHHPLHRMDLMTADLATVAGVMDKFKRQYDFWLHYITPALLTPWLLWICYEFTIAKGINGMNAFYTVIPLIIGAAIGGMIGYIMHRKTVNLAKDIIRQIEE